MLLQNCRQRQDREAKCLFQAADTSPHCGKIKLTGQSETAADSERWFRFYSRINVYISGGQGDTKVSPHLLSVEVVANLQRCPQSLSIKLWTFNCAFIFITLCLASLKKTENGFEAVSRRWTHHRSIAEWTHSSGHRLTISLTKTKNNTSNW